MPLNLGNSGGDFLPILKYNAKAGRWYVREDDEDVEVDGMTAMFDFENIQTGWLHFGPTGPDWRPDPDLSTATDSPGGDFKRGFKIHVYAKKQLGGAREFMSSSQMACGAIKKLYAEYEESGKGAQLDHRGIGQVPVVKCTGTNAITGKHGTNFEPVLEIVKWMKRPPEDDLPILSGGASTPAPAPVTNSASDDVGELEDEFV